MILFALGVDKHVVGRTAYCLSSISKFAKMTGLAPDLVQDRLKHWGDLPVVGFWPDVDLSRAKALQADLILASGTDSFGVRDTQEDAANPCPLINYDTRTFADLISHIRDIGRLIDKESAAEDVIAYLDAERTGDQPIACRLRTPRVLFEYCVCIKFDADADNRRARPDRFVMVGGHLAPELIRLSGGTCLFTQSGDTVKWVSANEIYAAQPDIILQFDCGGCANARKHPIGERKGLWPDLKAVQGNCVFELSENISNPNLCFPLALRKLKRIMRTYFLVGSAAVPSSRRLS
jgi:ABC-type Fe3+-hydroxamate transport system substrate-binding protein